MLLYVSPYVNHKIKYSKKTIWLKLENASTHLCSYIHEHLKSDYFSTVLFPGNLYCFKSSRKLTQHAVSTFQHYWKWRGGGGGGQEWHAELNNLKFLWGDDNYSLFYISWYNKINFYIKKSVLFFDIRTSFFWFKKSISLYQKILDIKKSISWYQEFFLDIKNSISSYQEINFIFWHQELCFLK